MMSVHCRPIPSVVRNRPYQADSTTSRPICEVKLPRARVVLRWGTTWEVRVLILLRVFNVRTHVLYVILLIFFFVFLKSLSLFLSFHFVHSFFHFLKFHFDSSKASSCA